MQKKLNEKEEVIYKLSQKLVNVTENSKKNSEININNVKKNYIIKLNELIKENEKLKAKNEELLNKIDENEEQIKRLEDKNKLLIEQINELNQKYNIFIMNDEKKYLKMI